jgi:hypothetical protein
MEHPTGVMTRAPVPPDDYDPESASLGREIGKSRTMWAYHHEGFPQSDDSPYWEQHPDEKKQVFYWIEKQGRSFEQIALTRTTEHKGKATAVREKLFRVRGSKDAKGGITDLSIEFLGAMPNLSQIWLPADYHNKDAADALLLEVQEQLDPNKHDRLGKVALGTVPKEEAFPLKYTIWGYFRMGTRNAEVDTVVTITGTKRRVFYTLRFRQNNDVDVERIGEEGKEARLDPNRLDITGVFGFESNADDPKKLKSWLGKRYRHIKPVGATVTELRESANTSLRAEAGRPGWFKENYTIVVLDATEAKERLMKVFDAEAAAAKKTLKKTEKEQVVEDLLPFTPDELKLLEFSLEPMSESILSLLKDVRLVRKKTCAFFDKEHGAVKSNPDIQGITYSIGSQNTIVICDAAIRHSSLRFLGGTTGVRPGGGMTFTHELGHVVGSKAAARAKFSKFVKDRGIQPFTPYAASNPGTELFPEAFYLYETDPEWLKSSHPEVFDWFETLSVNGKPPLTKK